jgi:organic hydroperoxide reductase OsmC/OhrA
MPLMHVRTTHDNYQDGTTMGWVVLEETISSMEPHFYNIDINWKAGRSGMMCSPEVSSPKASLGCIEVATPPEFPKGVPGIWSPEHLFTASVASCFMTTFLSIAENSRLDFGYFTCHAKGKLESVDGKMVMSEVHLFTEVGVLTDTAEAKAQKVLQKAEHACLISNSIKSKVLVASTIVAIASAAK